MLKRPQESVVYNWLKAVSVLEDFISFSDTTGLNKKGIFRKEQATLGFTGAVADDSFKSGCLVRL